MALTNKDGVSFENVQPGTYTAIIRHGEAEPIYPPRVIDLQAQITEPLNFYRTRKNLNRIGEYDRIPAKAPLSPDDQVPVPFFRPQTTSVVVNREEGYLTLIWDETSEHLNRITGTLQTSEYYKELGINDSKKQRSPNDLADVLQRHRFLFKSQEAGMEIISKLKNLKATIQTDIENAKDDRANSKKLVEHKVTSNIPKGFFIVFSPYKGFKKEEYPIAIVLENVGPNVTCWLESIEALEKMEALRESIFDQQLKDFKEDGIAIIEC